MTDYEEEYSSYLEQEDGVLVWSLTITRVTPDMAGFYQCEVSEASTKLGLQLVPRSSCFHHAMTMNFCFVWFLIMCVFISTTHLNGIPGYL